MANPPAGIPNQASWMDRLRRELRNPSMLTVMLAILAVLAIPLALLVPSWVETTQESFRLRDAAERQRDATILSSSVLVPSQITPFMFDQVENLEQARSPADWHRTSFTLGPCASENLSQLPPGQYASAIASTCSDLERIQANYSADCASVVSCNISPEAIAELQQVRQNLLEAFADSGLVLPYNTEELVGP